jgi:hypothetical protein
METYTSKRISAVHPELGGFEIEVHFLRSPNGAEVFIAFRNATDVSQSKVLRHVIDEGYTLLSGYPINDTQTECLLRMFGSSESEMLAGDIDELEVDDDE